MGELSSSENNHCRHSQEEKVLGTPVVGTEMTTESFIIVCRVEAEGKAVAQ